SVIQNGWGTLKDSKTWLKAGANAGAGAIVGATGGLGAGLVATATTSFGVSLVEDAIDGNKLDYRKAITSSVVSTATFGIAKYGADKFANVLTKNYWSRGYTGPVGKGLPGNTNALMRFLEKNASTSAGVIVSRLADVTSIGESIGIDRLFPAQKKDNNPPVQSEQNKTGNFRFDEPFATFPGGNMYDTQGRFLGNINDTKWRGY